MHFVEIHRTEALLRYNHNRAQLKNTFGLSVVAGIILAFTPNAPEYKALFYMSAGAFIIGITLTALYLWGLLSSHSRFTKLDKISRENSAHPLTPEDIARESSR